MGEPISQRRLKLKDTVFKDYPASDYNIVKFEHDEVPTIWMDEASNMQFGRCM